MIQCSSMTYSERSLPPDSRIVFSFPLQPLYLLLVSVQNSARGYYWSVEAVAHWEQNVAGGEVVDL